MRTHAGAYVDVEGLNPVEVELALNPTAKVYIHIPMYVCIYVRLYVWYMYVYMYLS